MSLTSYKMESNVENEQKTEIFEKSQETPNKTKRPASGVCSFVLTKICQQTEMGSDLITYCNLNYVIQLQLQLVIGNLITLPKHVICNLIQITRPGNCVI